MGKKTLFIFAIFFIFCGALWAGGNRDGNVSRTAADSSGFTDSIDISDKKPGTYNFYMEAQDNAGNTMRAGPDNIFIDPRSDLPQATIVNPLPNLRVQGNMNIVGIAVDDDGVDNVQLSIRRGTNGKGEEIFRARATGSDFWSHFLDTSDSSIWTDGMYTLTAWAIDINGLSGISENFRPRDHKRHDVYWLLDRKKPEIAVQSHSVGELVSGRIRLRGTAGDGNGINAFSYSTDGGEHYTAVRVSLDRRTGLYNWDINLNTASLENGPAVIWFQAQDGNGSIGTTAHLLFVNNIGPDVDIVYPPPNMPVNGIFSISAYASHPVGLKSVRWSVDKMGGQFELLPGNHWFSTEVDLRGIRTNNITVEIRAEDVSGNVTVKRQRYNVDQNADLPVVTLSSPSPGTAEGGIVVKGSVADDDGVSSVIYSINGGTAVELPCSGYFQFLIPSVPEGNNNLEVWAKDVTGVIGPKVLVRGIVVPPPLAEPRITMVTTGSGNNAVVSDFYTGMRITLQPRIRTAIELTVNSENIASASVVFGNLPAVAARPAGSRGAPQKASIQIPETLASGFTKIELRLTDRQGRDVVYTEYANISNPSVPSSYAQSGLVWVRPNQVQEGIMRFNSADETLLGLDGSGVRFSGATIRGTGAANINAEVDGRGRVVLSAIYEGNHGPLSLYLQRDDGVEYESDPFNIVAAFSGPTVTLTQVPDGWLQDSVPVGFNVYSENSRIASVGYSLDMGVTWADLLSSGEIAALRQPVNANFTRNIDISELGDGSINLLIRAVNEAGRDSTVNFTVKKDTLAPQAQLVMPIVDARVNGTIKMAFAISEKGGLKTVSYRRPASAGVQEINSVVYNAQEWTKDYPAMFLEVLMDSLQMPLGANMVFVFEDMAGNRSEINTWPFVIDQEMDIPVVQLSLPLDDEVITADFIVSGVMFDDDAIRQVYYKIDNSGEQIIVAENGFSIPIPLSSLTDNEHTITVTAEDIYGVKSEPVTRKFKVSLIEPTAAVTSPLYDKVLRDVIEIKGNAVDNNGISNVSVSLDNGNTYNRVYGTDWYVEGSSTSRRRDTEWNYQFNTRILEDGPHVVFIRVWDGLGVSATYASMINIDNTPPEIIMDSPGDGSISVGTVSVMGRTIDPNLESVVLELRSLEGAQISPDLRARRQELAAIIKDTLDLRSHPDGLYNVTVVATDSAGNITRTSRNFELTRTTIQNYIEILYPLDNEVVSGEFNMYGLTGGPDKAGSVTISINDVDVQTSEVDDAGFFRFNLGRENFFSGENKVTVRSSFGGERTVQSRQNNVFYNADGPWVTIDSFSFGDYAYERPYLYGRTGYILSAEDTALLADRSTERIVRDAIRDKRVDYTEISFDNGVTYQKAGPGRSRGSNYSYRLETGDMTEGMHYILVRTTMKNGEIAVTRMLVQVDKTPPVIRLITPETGGRYNERIAYSASATDDVELNSLTYHLRVGNKSAYEIPGFLQGLYLEGIIPPFVKQLVPEMPNFFAGGATYTDFGIGLSFFDDNVKVQVQYGYITNDIFESLGGQNPPGLRYGGHVLGIKLLANIYQLPFGAFAGPDWEWLSASFALGANFSLFDLAQEGYTQSGTSTWMSALLLQVEFPKVTIPKWKALRKFSLFTEGQLWFVPTDVNAEALGIQVVIPHVIVGFRLYIF